jgi:hypothetical protein
VGIACSGLTLIRIPMLYRNKILKFWNAEKGKEMRRQQLPRK